MMLLRRQRLVRITFPLTVLVLFYLLKTPLQLPHIRPYRLASSQAASSLPQQNTTDFAAFDAETLLERPWYGNASRVGPSPYDYRPRALRPGEKRTRIIFLLWFSDYLERMNSVFYEIVEAAMVHPRVEVDVWGPGWEGWDDTLSLSANLEGRILPYGKSQGQAVGCGYYDIMVTFSQHPNDKERQWFDSPGCGTVHWHQYGDCHADECLGQTFANTGNITASKYAFELVEQMSYRRFSERFPGSPMQLLVHSPDAANEWDYFPLPAWTSKTDGAVLFGASYDLYTIRPTVVRAIEAKPPRTFISRFSHPGFYVHRNRIPKKKLLTYEKGHASYAPQVRKREAFAEGMRRAQICVFDSSMERKAIRKYAQALLSGCVIAADLPTEQEEAFRNFMIVLRPHAPIGEINEIIRNALLDPVELQRKALAGFAYAREHLTNTRKIDRMLSDVERYRRGVRGYSFPEPFRMQCRKYWGFNTPWCPENRPRARRSVKPTSGVPRSPSFSK